LTKCLIWPIVKLGTLVKLINKKIPIVIQTLGLKSKIHVVATLALGLWPKQGLVKVRAKKEAQKSHFMLPRVQESVREWTFTLPSELPLWELESQWIPKFSKNECKSQNSLNWWVPYIIGKLLEPKCPKWAHMTHLNI
jgi:hypothetical protein